MSGQFTKTVIKDNWYLLILLGLMFVIAAYMFITSEEGKQPGSPAPGSPGTSPPGGISPPGGDRPPRRLTEREKTLQTIEDHRKKVEAAPQSEDTPAYLKAMANLYAQELGDYDEAIICYERILTEYPDWIGIRGVYPDLARCYERKGDSQGARQVYREMMRAFPEDSQEHAFARQQLGY